MSEQCSEHVYTGGWGGSQCSRKGTVLEDGKWKCKQHSKAAEEARRAKSAARWQREDKLRHEAYEAEVEETRRAKCYPELLAALEPFVALFEAGVSWTDTPAEDTRLWGMGGKVITVGDVLRGRAAIKKANAPPA